jgi:thymidylate synthase
MYVKGPTIQYVWPKLLYRILNQGQDVLDERGSNTKELLNVLWRVTRPGESKVPEGYPLREESIKVYEDQFLDPNRYTFVYTYGNRLRKEFGLDQLTEAIERIKENNATRRATMVTFNPMTDFSNDEIPCFIMGDFKLRDGVIYTTGVWRSHDAFGAIPANFFALKKMADKVAEEIEAKTGPITVQSVSAHIYEINYGDAKRASKFMG